ncbi:MAG TPA: glycosyltransferase family 39 protein [Vicinamibacterales bacterium]|nr:glycosyltransferase family 39 protein [Vicinamibacterales bacterium]
MGLSRPVLAAIFALVTALYLFDLANAPVYFGGDEAHFASVAHSIATTGRNLRGDRFPLFVNLADPLGEPPAPWGDTYYHPILFYLDALVMLVVPPTITAARLPIAIVGGLICPLLLYAVARRVIGDPRAALIAALVLALAPVHVILSRQAVDYILPVPFVLAWLWCLDVSLRKPDGKYVALAGLVLGAGCYSYIASWGVMPMLLALSWAIWLRAGLGWRSVTVSTIAFAVPVAIAPLWIALHPEMVRDTLARYSAPPDVPKTPFIPTFISLIQPLVWFVRGGPSLTTATARSGVVLIPVAGLLAAGAIALTRHRDWRAAVIVSGVLIGLLPAALKGEPGMIQRAMYVLPFVALAAGFGFAWLWETRIGRLAAVLLLAGSAVQFGYFYFDFMTHYKLRSAFYYDPVAFRDVARELIHSLDAAPQYYFTTDVDDADVKWRFYTTLEGRTDLLSRTKYVGRDDRPAAAAGSVLITYDDTARITALVADGWRIETVISDVDNRRASVVLRKLR